MPPEVSAPLRRERRWALMVACGAVMLTTVPYLFGWSLQGARPELSWFSWLGYNLDDSCVYLSWMRQAADGHFFQRNLFTTDPQVGRLFNVFFLALGWLAGLLHVPLIYAYQAARVVLGVALLRAAWWLIELLIADPRARRAAFLLLCFSAGLGWVPGLWRRTGVGSPVDVWQPEAITFLCLYLSPLFLVSLLLMVGVIGWLLVGDRTGSWRPAVYAGLCGLLLGNIHTYDVVTLSAIWGAYLAVRTVVERKVDGRAWARALLALALTCISTGQVLLALRADPVFAKRYAVVTLSPELRLYLLAYLPLMALALVALWACWRPRPAGGADAEGGCPIRDRLSVLLLAVWAVVNLAIAYVPLPVQRKLLMGEHIPLALLGGVGLAWLLRGVRGRLWAAAAAVVVLAMSLTNWRFTLRDAGNFQDDWAQTRIHRPYMYAGEVAALQWLRDHAPRGAPIQPLPWVAVDPGTGRVGFVDTTPACFAPGLTGHPVNAGHWGETPDFAATMGRWVLFMRPELSDDSRRELLRRTGVRYVVFTQKHVAEGDAQTLQAISVFAGTPPACLRLVPEASNSDADVYEVSL